MDHSNKRNQNKSYYERNRERILEKARQRAARKSGSQEGAAGASVVKLFQETEPGPKPKLMRKSPPKRLPSFGWEIPFLIALVGSMTWFLLHETAKYFFASDGNWASACLKAGILEGSTIAFTLMQNVSVRRSVFNKLMVFLIYAFGVWVVSYPVVSLAQSQHVQAESHQKSIQELETEITKKEAVRDQYWKQDRVTFSRRYDVALDALRVRLESERKEATAIPEGRIVQGVLVAGILFRVLVMISNLFCIQYLRGRATGLN